MNVKYITLMCDAGRIIRADLNFKQNLKACLSDPDFKETRSVTLNIFKKKSF